MFQTGALTSATNLMAIPKPLNFHRKHKPRSSLPPSSMKIILTSASSYKAISIARFLKKINPASVIIGVNDRQVFGASKYFDKVVRLPSVTDSVRYLAELTELVDREKVDLLFPVRTEECVLLHKERELFGSALEYLGSNWSFEQLNSKEQSMDLSTRLGIKTPRRFPSIGDAKIPFVVKPSVGSGSKGVIYVPTESARQKTILLKGSENGYVVEEFIRGQGGGCGCFCSKGEVLTFHCHRRLAEYPASGGSSVYRESFFSEEMVAATRRLVEATNWSGFLMTEFKLTPSGEVCFIEANPRIWGSINHGLANGFNYFQDLMHTRDREQEASIPGVRTYLSPLCYVSFFKYASTGRLRPFIDFLRNWRINQADISLLDDPGGWASTVSSKFLSWKN